ncbi:suppressor of fused domain protein [Hamadaea tsunoensis]|uniref:suppressor of fused domain protein n=1 Tax=Hamadaea tsunoensis TaxID=53368 RepID=UPI0007E8CACC|nr:suppressor of fused domain protein [Hamadaea tsunoensis]
MDHDLSPAAAVVRDHLAARFPARELTVLPATQGPIYERVPGLHMIRLAPTREEGGWLYVTAGLWDATQHHGHGLEFVLLAPDHDPRHIETLTMTAYYHAAGGSFALDHGHTVPIGRPWIRGSACRFLVVSLPYLWGPSLEMCSLPEGHARILWLLPITRAERNFKHKHGLEALEQKLEAARIAPSDPCRKSVIPGWWQRMRRATAA